MVSKTVGMSVSTLWDAYISVEVLTTEVSEAAGKRWVEILQAAEARLGQLPESSWAEVIERAKAEVLAGGG